MSGLNAATEDTFAVVLRAAGRDAEAAEHCRRSLAPETPSTDILDEPAGLLTRAALEREGGRLGDALATLRRSRELAERHELLAVVADALQLEADVLAGFERYQEAYETLVRHLAVARAMRREQAACRAAVLQSLQSTDELRRRSARLEEIAERDQLTGARNRRHLEQGAPGLLEEAQERGLPLAVAIVDVDHFKRVNDELGHGAGDEALRPLVRALASALPTSALVSRLGGEEFVVVMPGAALDAAGKVCERARGAIEAVDRPRTRPRLAVTASSGLTTTEAAGVDMSEPLRSAELALYEAKRSGRNRVVAAGGSGRGGSPDRIVRA